MTLLWCAAGLVEAGKQFRRVNGHLHLPALRTARERHVAEQSVSADRHDENRERSLMIIGPPPKFHGTRDILPGRIIMSIAVESPETSKLQRALDNALGIQQPLVERHVQRLKRSRPGCNPAGIVRVLEKEYLATVAGSGAAVGGAAVAPGVGTGVSIALSLGETVTSLNATVLYILAVSEVYGVPVQEIERRRTLLLAILLGDSGTNFVQRATERTGQHWAKQLISRIPMSQINQINRVLGPRFITKYGTKQGILVLGRAIPFGFGVIIGGVGSRPSD